MKKAKAQVKAPEKVRGGDHELESNAYELGKVLSQDFQLPNLKDKGKKRTLARYIYDLTDKNKGSGQILDKKATLKKIVETNIILGNIPDVNNIDTSKFLISPQVRWSQDEPGLPINILCPSLYFQ